MVIKPLPKWAYLNSTYAFEDTESNTAIEQTARLYKAMQEIIDDYNKFVEQINNEIDVFTAGTNEDIETFKIGLRQEFQDFIDAIEVKIQNQDMIFEQYKDVITEEIHKIDRGFQEELKQQLLDYEDETTANIASTMSLYQDTIDEEVTTLSSTVGDYCNTVNSYCNRVTACETTVSGFADRVDAQDQVVADAKDYMETHLNDNLASIVDSKLQTMNIRIATRYDAETESIEIVAGGAE